MVTAVAAAFLWESSLGLFSLSFVSDFFWALDNYPRPQFCSQSTGGNGTYLPHRNGVRLSVTACQDAVRFFGGRCNTERHAQNQLSLKLMGVGALQG